MRKMGMSQEPKYRINCREKDMQEYSDMEHMEFSVTFNIRGDGVERRLEKFIEKVVKPLKEKYPYAEICIEVNG
ncbi:MAG: hypothetical protein KHY34_08660 [Lachnospiraceae bacterium]|nr:hypothetical protein [Lachnospiraceae bacterium]